MWYGNVRADRRVAQRDTAMTGATGGHRAVSPRVGIPLAGIEHDVRLSSVVIDPKTDHGNSRSRSTSLAVFGSAPAHER